MVRAKVVTIALAATVAGSASASDRPVDFHRQVGPWNISGDIDVGACIITRRFTSPSQLFVAAVPGSRDWSFSLSNTAWQSLEHRKPTRISAHFFNSANKLTDSWSLDAQSLNDGVGPPKINWSISFSSNDGASFRSQFARSSRLMFEIDGVPLGVFPLDQSGPAISALLSCQVQLQMDDRFDPFAGK
jgi:hypothetical protein